MSQILHFKSSKSWFWNLEISNHILKKIWNHDNNPRWHANVDLKSRLHITCPNVSLAQLRQLQSKTSWHVPCQKPIASSPLLSKGVVSDNFDSDFCSSHWKECRIFWLVATYDPPSINDSFDYEYEYLVVVNSKLQRNIKYSYKDILI